MRIARARYRPVQRTQFGQGCGQRLRIRNGITVGRCGKHGQAHVDADGLAFALGEDLYLTDAEGREAMVRVVNVVGRSALLEYGPVIRREGDVA